MDEIIASVIDQYPQLIIVACIFILMLWLLNKNLFGPVFEIMARRKSDRESLDQETGTSVEESTGLIAKRKESLLRARNEAVRLKEAARNEARDQARVELEATTGRLNTIREQKAGELEKESADARETMSADIPRMAREIAERILQRPLA